MVIRDILNAEDIEALLSSNSKSAIEEFLSYYGESSKANFRSSIYRLLYNELSKDEVSKVDFNDYRIIFPNDDKKLKSQEIYRQRFFKFLYAFDYIDNNEGFDSIWIKDVERKDFKKPSQREIKTDKNNKKNILTLEEITKIQKIIESDSTKLDTLKMQFCWFAIFELGLEVDELRKNITSDNFNNGKLNTSNGILDIPRKYDELFEKLNQRDDHNGFGTIDLIFESIGNIAGLERKLLPRTVKLTRKAFMLTCCSCQNEYSNLTNNWISVNNRIVCIECAEDIKKKLTNDVDISTLESINVEDNVQLDLSILYSFEDLKKELKSKPIDYLKLHELQMEIGNLGEAYVYEYECNKLKGTNYFNRIDEKKALDSTNGYDILSFSKEGVPLHIEVKCTVGKGHSFYLSENELKTSKLMKEKGLIYLIYFVQEILSDNPTLVIIDDVALYEQYQFEAMNWKVSKV